MKNGTNGTPQAPLKWVPVLGQFDANDTGVIFHGKCIPVVGQPPGIPPDQKDQPAFGLILSNRALADGVLSADVEFSNVTTGSVCEFAIAYDANAQHIVTAGLGGVYDCMFGIREFRGDLGRGWVPPHRAAGDRANLKSNRPYHMEVRFRGAIVSLVIDGVPVGVAEVTSPFGQDRQVGLYCRGEHDITVRNFEVSGAKPRAFVVMQFSPEFDDVYKDVIKEVCKTYDVNQLRADESSGPGLIIADIVREIEASQLIIADITPPNPNVYFEVGYGMARRKPTILLARKGTHLPFDVAGFRVLLYEDSIGGKRRLEDGLARHLQSILENPQSSASDVMAS